MAALALCCVLSGAASLIYQTVWLRQLAAVFGTSEVALATVLAAFMGNMAVGAWVAQRRLLSVDSSLRTYAGLEAIIALGALAVPPLMHLAGMALVALMGHQPDPPASGSSQGLFYILATFVVLAVPAGCMGATLPILVRHLVRSDAAIGPRIGLLYALNTAGAVVGTLVAAFLLLPHLGLQYTALCGVALNALAGAISLWLSRRPTAHPTHVEDARPATVSRFHWILPLMAASGAVSFLYEILWTRLLSHALGGTIHSFAAMLAAFLCGIALGGGLAGSWATDRRRAAVLLCAAQVAAAILATVGYASLWWVPFTQTDLVQQVPLVVSVILPSALCMGATFPLAVRLYASRADEAGPATAQIYVWNTLGAIAGSLLTGYALLPALGFAGLLRLGAAANLLLGLVALLYASQRRSRQWIYAGLAAAWVALYRPPDPIHLLDFSALDSARGGQFVYTAVGRASTVLAKRYQDGLYVRTNGLPEATIRARSAPPLHGSQHWLMVLPLLARPQAQSALAIGLGGGVLLEGLPTSLRAMDVIELEPEVVNANRHLGPLRHTDPLQDPRIHIVTNDARSALALTDKRYDLIVSQPSHPWTSGASHLYTSEFVALVKQRLAPDGVFVQWMGGSFTTAALLGSLCATVQMHFDHLRVYQPSPGLFYMLASDSPLTPEQHVLDAASQPASWRDYIAAHDVRGVEDVLIALTLDETGSRRFSAAYPPYDDDDNRLASQGIGRYGTAHDPTFFEELRPFDPLLNAASWVHQLAPVDWTYAGRRLIEEGFDRRALHIVERVVDPVTGYQIKGYGLKNQGLVQQATVAFNNALSADPDAHGARYEALLPIALQTNDPSGLRALGPLTNALPPSGRAVFTAWTDAGANRWDQVAALDSTLGQARYTDAWFPEATILRALWRIGRPADRANSIDRLREALQILDRHIQRAHVGELLYLRQDATHALGDVPGFAATSWRVALHVEAKLERAKVRSYRLQASERNTLQRRLRDTLARLAVPPFSAHETGPLSETLHDLLAQLEAASFE